MSDPLSQAAQRTALASLFTLLQRRATEETRIRSTYESGTRSAQKHYDELRASIESRLSSERQSLETAYDTIQRKAAADFRSQQLAADERHEAGRKEVVAEFAEGQRTAEGRLNHESWEATTVYDARQPALAEQLAKAKATVQAHASALGALNQNAVDYLVACRQQRVLVGDKIEPPPLEPAAGDPFKQLAECRQHAEEQLAALETLSLPRVFLGHRRFALFPLILAPLVVVAIWAFGEPYWQPAAAATVAAMMILAGLLFWLSRRASQQAAHGYRNLRNACFLGTRLQELSLAHAQSYYETQRQKSASKRDHELAAARERFSHATTVLVEQRDEAFEQLQRARAEQHTEIAKRRDAVLAEAHDKYPRLLEEAEDKHDRDLASATQAFVQATSGATLAFERELAALISSWQQGMEQAHETIAASIAKSDRLFPTWDDSVWSNWTPPTTPPPAIRFGQLHVDAGELSRRALGDGNPSEFPAEFELPALLPFPSASALLIKASGNGKDQAIDAVQATMLRLVSSIPPGKLKFTIIDPVGLGENFAGFMHLADYDESLVSNRIWTEPGHIEQRLTDLTEQMENVIQKYLRNDFRTIEEYNAFAGEVAEAFRVLVVANFPVNFTDAAARRLNSIITSGARCGVFTLMTVDSKQPLPAKFDLSDIERQSTTITWNGSRFVWRDADFGKFPLELDRPPGDQQLSRIVHSVGEATKNLRRVEVPFEYIAPPRDQWWTGSTASGIDVPLGRVGATKLQHLRLGQGTAQHVLIAGKTGSGKSTLLHALVTNLALRYSPDEVELYLVDFKKGVEFKTYATHELPHARVIAVESEREFGLSVLERLDAELKARGDKFRALGVQDLAACRAADPTTPMPRVLLIVDEFQELFTEDDRLAQQSALLLDRLVRQGRAFGIHVLLGSQTLGGAYSLARSTIGQMAVRIALQCSEADAHLILSDDNSAARLLSRPGEAIYNDANGLIEGNSPFQVVWLADERRETYLQQIAELSAQQQRARRERQVVFDGHQAADLPDNSLLSRAIDHPTQDLAAAPLAWLGDAVAIKDPTAAVLRRQGGANLLMIGQQEEAARGMFASALLGLAAQHPQVAGQRGAQFYLLEARRERASSHALAELAAVVPHTTHLVGRRDEGALMAELSAEVTRRHESDDRSAPPIYLFVFDLARFRDLRRSDDDMGFSFGGEAKPPSPAKLFNAVLKDGPEVGVHTILWCDSPASLARVFDRQALREFDLRVLFQMSAGDSSQLIDTPIASKLGAHYALLHDEEAGRLEKFRPYAWPREEWLTELSTQLREPKATLPVTSAERPQDEIRRPK